MTSLQELVVVLPVSTPDFHLAMKWLKWAQVLNTRLGACQYDLVVLCAASVEPAARNILGEQVALMPNAVLEIQPEYYERPEYGYAAAANVMFRCALELTERLFPGRPTLWCEADTVPMHEAWVAHIAQEYRLAGRPFMGDFHPSSDISHMTGNAVYPPDWRVRAPSLARLPEPQPEWGWDSKCAPETVPQSHRACTIQQIWLPPRFTEKTMQMIHPETALFHRSKDGTVIDVLCARLGVPEIPLGVPIAPLQDRAPTAVKPIYPPGPRVEILVVCSLRDEPFLRYCLRGLSFYAAAFAGITLAVPARDRTEFAWIPKGVKLVTMDELPGKGFLHHLIMKCRADELCPDAEMIMHVDADCMAWEPFSPDDYVYGKKPRLVRERYDRLLNPNRRYWRETVTAATGLYPTWETMVRHPQVHHRGVYKRMRQLVEWHTKLSFNDYVLSCRNEFPQTFCEFNTLGAVALQEFESMYTVEDYDREKDARECGQDVNGSWQYIYRAGRDKFIEGWSHSGIHPFKDMFDKIMLGQRPQFFVK